MALISKKTALITGSAGFIGFYISRLLLKDGWRVVGVDCLSTYYDVELKLSREALLMQHSSFRRVRGKIEAKNLLMNLFAEERPQVVIHLAAQAGVRHSINEPRAYLESNIVGTFELLEAARAFPPLHTLMASTSSAYGANDAIPYKEVDMADHQLSFYAATKKAGENMAHSYAHLFKFPITMFRFFTVYGPWGRPDMALFKFTRAIFNDEPIEIYNNGEMERDFTYIDDLVEGIKLLIDSIPKIDQVQRTKTSKYDSKSLVAPFRIVNIGNSKPENLIDFIKEIESCLGLEAKKRWLPMQAGDVEKTWADTTLLRDLTGFVPKISITEGVSKFIDWYREYYRV